MNKLASILDPIQAELPPALFVDSASKAPKMRPIIRHWLLHTIYEVLDQFNPEAEQWATLVLTGSLTTYQYGSYSDCDISVFVNPQFLPEWDRSALIGKVIHELDGTKVAGTNFPLQVFIVSPKITRELLYQPGLRSGYDLNTDQWIVPPEPERSHDVAKDYNAFYIFAMETADKLKSLIKYNPRQALEYSHYIHKKRQEEEARGHGDYGIFNITYKMLDRSGILEELSQLEPKTASSLTMEEVPVDPLSLDTRGDLALHSALRNGRFNWKYKGSQYHWSDNQHHYYREPTGAPAQHVWNGYGRTKQYYYDPELTHPENDEFRANFPLHPHPEWRSTMDFRNHVQADPNSIYRGMSHEEWEQARQRGYFQSSGDYNMGPGQEGVTLFSTDPDQSRSYADSFAPWSLKPGFNHPSYVVGINRPPNARADQVHDDREVVVPGQIPFSAVHSVYQIKPYVIEGGDMSIGTHNGQDWSRWSGGGSLESTAFRQMNPNEWQQQTLSKVIEWSFDD